MAVTWVDRTQRVSGHTVTYRCRVIGPGRIQVEAPGVIPFTVTSLQEVRDAIRALYRREASR